MMGFETLRFHGWGWGMGVGIPRIRRLGGSEVRDGRILILVDFRDAVVVYLFISYRQSRGCRVSASATSATFLPEVPWSAPRTHCHLVMRSSKENWGSSLFRLLGFRSPLPDSAGEFVLFAGFRVVRLKVFVLRTLSILETSSKILGRHSRDKVCGNEPPPFHMSSLTTHCVSIWGQNASAGHGWCGGRYLAGAMALFEINDSGGGRGSVASLICAGVSDMKIEHSFPLHPFKQRLGLKPCSEVEWSNLEGTPGTAKDGAGVLFIGWGTKQSWLKWSSKNKAHWILGCSVTKYVD